MLKQQRHIHGRRHERGMTLIEALVSLMLLSLIMVAFLGILETTTRLAKAQGQIADSTENLRFSMAALVRIMRMAGTGGIPLVVEGPTPGDAPTAIALLVENNLPSGQIRGGRTVVAGTDVLRIRGVINSELYLIQGDVSVDYSGNKIKVPDRSPYPDGSSQELRFPHNPAERPLLISLQRPYDITTDTGGFRHYNDFRIVEVADNSEPVRIDSSADGNGITWMTIDINTAGGSANLNPGGSYQEPGGGLAYAAGFIDDMIFFISLNDQNEPALYRFLGSGNSEELVPNISNLQVALGCDINASGAVEGTEWYGSKGNTSLPTTHQMNTLREVRISLVSRNESPDSKWDEKTVMPENAVALTSEERKFRHRVITVRTGLRSHPGLEAS